MAKTKDIVGFGEAQLASMSFAELMEAGVISITSIDDTVAVDQADLVDVPFILFEWEVKESQQWTGSYAVCRVKTVDGTRVFADGGAGICTQLEHYKELMTAKGLELFQPVYFPHGLRSSTYMTEVDGKPQQATTYYFDNRPL